MHVTLMTHVRPLVLDEVLLCVARRLDHVVSCGKSVLTRDYVTGVVMCDCMDSYVIEDKE